MMFRLVIFVLSVWLFPFQSLGSTTHVSVQDTACSSTFQRIFDLGGQDVDYCTSHLSVNKSTPFQQTYFWDLDFDLDKDLNLDKVLVVYDLAMNLFYSNENLFEDDYRFLHYLPVETDKFLLFEQIKIPF